jgi:hypothetical protein
MRFGAFVARDEVKGFPFAISMAEFNWTLPKEINWQSNDTDDERAVQRAEEIIFREDVLKEGSRLG